MPNYRFAGETRAGERIEPLNVVSARDKDEALSKLFRTMQFSDVNKGELLDEDKRPIATVVISWYDK